MGEVSKRDCQLNRLVRYWIATRRGAPGLANVSDIEDILWRLRSLDPEFLRVLAIRAVLRALLVSSPHYRYYPDRDDLQFFALWSALDAWTGAIFPNREFRGPRRPPFHPHYNDLPERWLRYSERLLRYSERDDDQFMDVLIAAILLSPRVHENNDRYLDAIRVAHRGLQRSNIYSASSAFFAELSADLALIHRERPPRELIGRPLWPRYRDYEYDADRIVSAFRLDLLEPELARLIHRWFRELVDGNASPDLARYALELLDEARYERLEPLSAPRREEAEDRMAPGAPLQSPSAAPQPSPFQRVKDIALTTAAGAVLGVKGLWAALSTLPNVLSRARLASIKETAVVEEGALGARYTDISIFAGVPERLGAPVTDEALVFAKPYTVEVAIRHIPIGLRAVRDRTNVTPFLSQTGPSELLAVLTSYDVAPGDTEDFDIPNPVQSLVVPSVGDSEEKNALFQITPLRGSGATRRCNLILRLYYKLDLIDQLRISILIGPAKTAKDQVDVSSPPLFIDTIEARTLPDFALNLAPRSLNIVVSRPRGASRIRLDFVMPEDNAHFVGTVDISNDDLDDLLSKTRDQLLAMALSAPFDTIAIDGPSYRDQLRKLAQIGEQAKQLLFDFGKTGSEASLRRIEDVLRTRLSSKSIVQIALDDTASDFRFPWSILFCGTDPRAADKVSDFWGYRFVIEEKPARLLLADPSSSMQRELCFVVWDKLKTLDAQRLVLDGGMTALPPIIVNTVDSRDQFLKVLKSDMSDILYVFAHGHSCSPAQPAISALLEKFEHAEQTPLTRQLIALFKGPETSGLSESDDSWIKLTKSLVTSADLRRDEYVLNRHPIVFLNMCQSAVLWPGVAGSFVRLFLDRRASAVLGTECTIPENVADEFGRLVIGKLFQREPLGISLLHAREELARSNNMLGLAYSLYGSASASLANGDGVTSPQPSA